MHGPFRIEVEGHKILRRLREDVKALEMQVGSVVAVEAGRPFRRQWREIGQGTGAIGARWERGAIVVRRGSEAEET